MMHRRIVKDFLDTLILLKLRKGMLSDHDIISYIQKRFDMPPISGTVYSCLHHLEREELIREVQPKNKKVYALTQKGEEKAKNLLKKFVKDEGKNFGTRSKPIHMSFVKVLS